MTTTHRERPIALFRDRVSLAKQTMGESVHADAEGATAPETLRHTDHCLADAIWRVVLHAPAEGITISGKMTDGASRVWQHMHVSDAF